MGSSATMILRPVGERGSQRDPLGLASGDGGERPVGQVGHTESGQHLREHDRRPRPERAAEAALEGRVVEAGELGGEAVGHLLGDHPDACALQRQDRPRQRPLPGRGRAPSPCPRSAAPGR